MLSKRSKNRTDTLALQTSAATSDPLPSPIEDCSMKAGGDGQTVGGGGGGGYTGLWCGMLCAGLELVTIENDNQFTSLSLSCV